MQASSPPHEAPPHDNQNSATADRPRRYSPLLAVLILPVVIVIAAVPCARVYPFSFQSALSSSERHCTVYEVYDLDGHKLDARDYGLDFARALNTSDRPGTAELVARQRIPDRKHLLEYVRRNYPTDGPYQVFVMQKTVGPSDYDTIGLIDAQAMTVQNPHAG